MGLQAKIIGRKNGVDMSADAAGKSACATGLQRQARVPAPRGYRGRWD
jgi:hypothetical protein